MVTLEPPRENESLAVDARQEIDLRIGAAFTRFMTLRLKKRFPQLADYKMISYGTIGCVFVRFRVFSVSRGCCIACFYLFSERGTMYCICSILCEATCAAV